MTAPIPAPRRGGEEIADAFDRQWEESRRRAAQRPDPTLRELALLSSRLRRAAQGDENQ